ncbi:MAG TPA: DUF3450 domain-containing protein [Gammaproteobacteria bacterium]|nr:DUF3450 domain-containing protein [Gammaproteobacteria bacterium]
MQVTALRSLLFCCAVVSPVISAATIEESLKENEKLSQTAQSSQQRVERLDDASQAMLEEYSTILAKAKALEGYNEQVSELIAAQHQELESYKEQLDQLQETEAAVIPQMRRMVEVLAEFVTADVPFLPFERTDRLAALQELMPRADVSMAEKYRRILEAYQIESDYGYTLEAWRGELGEGEQQRSVEFLRVGRVMLYYQTPNGHESGYWNAQARNWQTLDNSVRRPLQKAIAIARQQKTADWLELPIKTLALEVQP